MTHEEVETNYKYMWINNDEQRVDDHRQPPGVGGDGDRGGIISTGNRQALTEHVSPLWSVVTDVAASS
jgi:hypothetical protein